MRSCAHSNKGNWDGTLVANLALNLALAWDLTDLSGFVTLPASAGCPIPCPGTCPIACPLRGGHTIANGWGLLWRYGG